MNISIKRAQNDACIGSAEREKYGTQFKKTFRFLSMAALLVVGAIMTGCSSDDNIDNPQQPANKDNVVTLTATVGFEANAGTRAINPTSGKKTFESGKQIAVFYEDEEGKLKKAESTDFTPTGDNTKATFTVTLSTPKSGGKIRYVYPASMAKALDATPPAYPAVATIDAVTIDYSGIFGSQDGTLATLANYDLAVKDATLSGTDQPATVTLTNPLAICTFTFVTGETSFKTDITEDVNSLNVSDGTNTYHVTPSGLSKIYVAMKPVASHNIAFTAATGSKTYFKTTASDQTLAASTLYTDITVSMVELAKYKVIGADGNIYADVSAATTAGTTAVAKIVYLGNDAETSTTYNHGLALALSDVSGYQKWCTADVNGELCLASGHQYSSYVAAKGDMAGIANTDALVGHGSHTHAAANAARNYNSGTHPTGTSAWFLPSAGQWDKMMNAAGNYLYLARLYANLDETYSYWSSSEKDGEKAYDFYFGQNAWVSEYKFYSSTLVRACLAF